MALVRVIRPAHDHLQEHPDALATGSSACPASLIRLVHTLLADGRDDVVAPACVTCGRTALQLPAIRDTGRVCLACYRRDNRQPCARCGRVTKAAYRRPEGIICPSCRDAEPASRGTCQSCGYIRPLRKGRDGALRCDACKPRPKRECVGCGRMAVVGTVTAQGPLCRRCNPGRLRECGGCRQLRVIAVRATDEHPDLCLSCRPRTVGVCAGCGRHTFVNRQDRGRGQMLCQTCQPKVYHTCSRCGNHRPAQAIWPTGPVCRTCYLATKRQPAPCTQCRNTRVLVAVTADGQPICGRCAGADVDYLCRRCGLGANPPWYHGLCAGCVLADTVPATFGTDPESPLRPVADALLAHPEPARALRWLAQTATAKLLAQLATTAGPITHDTLDQLDGTNQAHLLRHMLVAAKVLPERIEHLDRIGPWLDDQLRRRPAAHARLVRPFVHWTLMRRARRNAAVIGFSEHAGTHLRARVLRALELLTWLDDHGLTLLTATEADIDRWMDNTPAYRRFHTRIFINWARRHGHARDIAIPPRPEAPQRLQPLTDHEVRDQLTRCLHDDTMPRDVRLAGALILLFGTTTARLVRLHTDAVIPGPDGQARLRLGPTPLTLPPPLATIAIEQAAAPVRSRSPLAQIARTPLLFPGRAPGQAISARRLRNKLRRHGIRPVPGRHAAIVAMTADIPSPVLADLLGVTPRTAVRWANAVNTDWTHYLAARADTTSTLRP